MLVAILLLIVFATGAWLWRGRLLKDMRWWVGCGVVAVTVIALAWIAFVDHDQRLQKTLGHLAMPAGLFWLLLLAISAGRWARGRVPSALGWTLLAMLYTAIGNAWLGSWLIQRLERDIPPLDIAARTPFDAVIVLGGGTSLSPEGRPQLGPAGDRVVVGAQLFLSGKTPVLVATGGSIDGIDRDRDIAAESAALWRSLGVPGEAIVTRSQPRNTREEIAACQTLAAERGWRRVGLVTSAWHLPRALSLCHRAGFEVVPLAADRRGDLPPAAFIWLVPHERGFLPVQVACWEYLGLLTGR